MPREDHAPSEHEAHALSQREDHPPSQREDHAPSQREDRTPSQREDRALAITIDEIALGDDPDRWRALGFTVSGRTLQLGTVRLRLMGPDSGPGVLGWSLRGIASPDLDGLPTNHSQGSPPRAEGVEYTNRGPEHPNGVVGIDHVVAMSPALDRSVQALRRAGLDLRRVREQPTPAGAPRQAFFRLGEVILEVVQEPKDVLARTGSANGPARFWGLALLTSDLDHTVAQLAEHASEIRPAVQPGRRIATLRRSAGLTLPVALMSHVESRE